MLFHPPCLQILFLQPVGSFDECKITKGGSRKQSYFRANIGKLAERCKKGVAFSGRIPYFKPDRMNLTPIRGQNSGWTVISFWFLCVREIFRSLRLAYYPHKGLHIHTLYMGMYDPSLATASWTAKSIVNDDLCTNKLKYHKKEIKFFWFSPPSPPPSTACCIIRYLFKYLCAFVCVHGYLMHMLCYADTHNICCCCHLPCTAA